MGQATGPYSESMMVTMEKVTGQDLVTSRVKTRQD